MKYAKSIQNATNTTSTDHIASHKSHTIHVADLALHIEMKHNSSLQRKTTQRQLNIYRYIKVLTHFDNKTEEWCTINPKKRKTFMMPNSRRNNKQIYNTLIRAEPIIKWTWNWRKKNTIERNQQITCRINKQI